jgi:hypothetical protein
MTDLNQDARALLDAARDGDGPTLEDRARVQRALASALAAGAAAGVTAKAGAAAAKASLPAGASAAGTAVATAGATKIAAWLGVGVVAGLASAGVVVATSRGPTPPAQAQKPRPALVAPVTTNPAANRAPAPAANQAGAPTATDPVEAATPASEAPAVAARAAATPLTRDPSASAPDRGHPAASTGSVATRPVPSSLADETAALEAARGALGRGDARTALALIEDHERRFPHATLVEERMASKVFALCGLGRTAEAARVARAFLAAAPASPLRARVLDSCAFSP